MSEKMVRILDPATGKIITIPARELAPEMIRADLLGVGDDVYVDASAARPGPILHPPLGPDLRPVMESFARTFHDVHPMTAEQWEDGFRRDLGMEQEIAIWVHIERVFRLFTDGRPLSPEQRHDIYTVVLACANNGKEVVLHTTNPVTLSKKRMQEIIEYFFATLPGDCDRPPLAGPE
jgi:hypothetical protein